MTHKALIRIAQVATPDLYLTDTIKPGRELYHTHGLQLAPNAPVLVAHDRDRPVGRVLELDEWDESDGRWVYARCALDEVPEWLRGGPYNGTSASMGWANIGTDQTMPGGWRRFNRGLVNEVSILPPTVAPREARARVVLLQRSPAAVSSRAPAGAAPGEFRTPPGATIRRYFETPITVR